MPMVFNESVFQLGHDIHGTLDSAKLSTAKIAVEWLSHKVLQANDSFV